MIDYINQCDETIASCKNILIVDDSKVVRSIVKKAFIRCPDIDAKLIIAESYKESVELLKSHIFHVAILDVNLPDAPNGEVIDLLLEKDVPVVVLTGSMNESTKNIILEKNIIEYISKNSPQSINYLISVVKRALNNYDDTVLIVDDSKSSRALTRQYLEVLHVKILESSSAEEAIDMLNSSNDEISLLLTDYEMPGKNGMELTLELRQKYSKDKLSIIAISASDNSSVATAFLRHGANDYITKPFTSEELSTRVNVNLELIDLFHQARDNAHRDFLTGMYNRRYFYESATAIVEKSKRKQHPVAVIMIDIDHFKAINDTYGHSMGDMALKEIPRILKKNLRSSDLVARFGGEEFCILLDEIKLEEVEKKFESIRRVIEENVISYEVISFYYTVSIGIFYGLKDTLERMITLSDDALYKAKESGRNKIVVIKN